VARKRIRLLCPACAGNRLSFPQNDNEPVVCEDCRVIAGTLKDAQAIIEGTAKRWPSQGPSHPTQASARGERHTAEIAAVRLAYAQVLPKLTAWLWSLRRCSFVTKRGAMTTFCGNTMSPFHSLRTLVSSNYGSRFSLDAPLCSASRSTLRSRSASSMACRRP
jgi:hypothetical protein